MLSFFWQQLLLLMLLLLLSYSQGCCCWSGSCQCCRPFCSHECCCCRCCCCFQSMALVRKRVQQDLHGDVAHVDVAGVVLNRSRENLYLARIQAPWLAPPFLLPDRTPIEPRYNRWNPERQKESKEIRSLQSSDRLSQVGAARERVGSFASSEKRAGTSEPEPAFRQLRLIL